MESHNYMCAFYFEHILNAVWINITRHIRTLSVWLNISHTPVDASRLVQDTKDTTIYLSNLWLRDDI